MTKKSSYFKRTKHCQFRMKQRYGLNVERKRLQRELNVIINSGKCLRSENGCHSDAEIYYVPYRGRLVRAVREKKSSIIMTVLPQGGKK